MSGDLTYFTNAVLFLVKEDIAKATGASDDSISVGLYAGSIVLKVTLPASAGGKLISGIQSGDIATLGSRKVVSLSFKDPYLDEVDKSWVAAQKMAVALGIDPKKLMADASRRAMLAGYCRGKSRRLLSSSSSSSSSSFSASSLSSTAAPTPMCTLEEIKVWAHENGAQIPGALGQFLRALAGTSLHKIVASFQAAARRLPSNHPTLSPTLMPTTSPTLTPTIHPSNPPTHKPSQTPSDMPTFVPTLHPSPSMEPTPGPSPAETTSNPSPSPSKTTHTPTDNDDAQAERLAKNHQNYLSYKYE